MGNKYNVLDMSKNNIVDETYLRKLLLEYELDDIYNNYHNYKNNFLDINSQLKCVEKVFSEDMNYIINELRNNWGVPIEIVSEVE